MIDRPLNLPSGKHLRPIAPSTEKGSSDAEIWPLETPSLPGYIPTARPEPAKVPFWVNMGAKDGDSQEDEAGVTPDKRSRHESKVASKEAVLFGRAGFKNLRLN